MCVVSAVLDTWRDQWKPQLPPQPAVPNYLQMLVPPPVSPFSPEQIEVMKKFLEMAEKAKEIDKLTNQPNCEDPEKVKFLDKLYADVCLVREMSENLNRDLDDICARLEKFIDGQAS